MYKYILLLGSLLSATLFSVSNDKESSEVDLVVYSFHRPLQAYAFFESLEKYATGFNTISLIYRVDNEHYDAGYEELLKRFTFIIPYKEREPRTAHSKPMIIQAAFGSPSHYVCFAVDDIIIKDYIDVRDCTRALEETGAYNFELRMGKNITKCVMDHNKQTPAPLLRHVRDDIYTWQFGQGQGGWCYPHNNDMAIYRKKDIQPYFVRMQFTGPLYEGEWARYLDRNKMGLCYGTSKIINVMLNLVQLEQPNWHSFSQEFKQKYDQYTPEALLKKFYEGYKIDITAFHHMATNDTHMEYEPHFITRHT